jgi:hypothetical protein
LIDGGFIRVKGRVIMAHVIHEILQGSWSSSSVSVLVTTDGCTALYGHMRTQAQPQHICLGRLFLLCNGNGKIGQAEAESESGELIQG